MNFSLEKNGVGEKIIPNLFEEAQKKTSLFIGLHIL